MGYKLEIQGWMPNLSYSRYFIISFISKNMFTIMVKYNPFALCRGNAKNMDGVRRKQKNIS